MNTFASPSMRGKLVEMQGDRKALPYIFIVALHVGEVLAVSLHTASY